MVDILTRAIDPAQYDKEDTNWTAVGQGIESPSRAHFWGYINRLYPRFDGMSVLDIGSGTGWLLAEALKLGASAAVGIEPSHKSVESAREQHPEIMTVHTTLEEFRSEQLFNVAFAIMSFTHVQDVKAAFGKLAQLAAPNAEVAILVPDPDYYRSPRKNYEVLYQGISPEEYVVQIKRPNGTIADIVRTPAFYNRAAEQQGFQLLQDIAVNPITNVSGNKYDVVADTIGLHLLQYRKD
jgi:trans-aconitate methyltransferase